MKRALLFLSIALGFLAVLAVGQLVDADDAKGSSTQPVESFSLDMAACFQPSADAASRNLRQLEAFEDLFDRADTADRKATVRLATANWLLSVPVAGACTAWLMGLDTPADRLLIGEKTESALKCLAEVRAILDDDADVSEKDRRRLTGNLEVLESFAGLFKALNSSADAEGYQSACARAALRLSAAREADDKAVSACALLWQSFAWEMAGRSYRALVSLPAALEKPGQWPYDFMCRLLHCRILADNGKYAAATTLSINLQTLCAKWLETERSVNDILTVRRLAALLQCRVGKLWMKQLNPSDAARLETMLIRVRKDLFESDKPVIIYQLEYAIPIIVRPPADVITSTSSAPATQTAPATASAPVH